MDISISLDVKKVNGSGSGSDGKSAYEIALEHGFVGTKEEWLESLNGKDGKSAYEIALEKGFKGTKSEWLKSLHGQNGKSAYEIALDHGFVGNEEEWLDSLRPSESGGSGTSSGVTTNHSVLTNRDAADQHPIPAITGLQEALSSLASTQNAHNVAVDAHADIRVMLGELSRRIAAVADSDDITLDQLSEIVEYIKANRDLIESITTGKVSVSDIVDDLVTNLSDRPLSAAQGVELNRRIETKQPAGDYPLRGEIMKEVEGAVEQAVEQAKESGEFNGGDGKSAYEVALDNGFKGSEQEWLESLKNDGSTFIEVIDDVSAASNRVVYIPDEVPDGDISGVLADYQRKPETVRIMYIKLDDGDATPSESWSSDSACIMTKNANIMVDFGRIQDYDRIKSALLENGVTRLDYIFLSHYHHDHCGCKNSNKAGSMSNAEAAGTSLSTLWADADIDTSKCVLVLPADAPTSLTSGEEPAWVKRVITALITQNNIRAAVPSIEGGYWRVDTATLGELPEWSTAKPRAGVIIRAHNCTAEQLTAYSSHGDYNECSTVLEVELGHTLATFTGDSSHTAQEVLCDRLRITDILKLGHHQTDAEWYQPFYERVNPRYAIASVDQDVYERYMANLVPTQASYMRPAVTWLAGKKIPFYPLPVSGTCIFESDGRTFELISNNRNYQPAAIGGAMLKTVPDGIGVDGVIDMTGTGWENYNLFNIQMLTSADGSVGTAIIAAKITAAGVTFIRGIGGTGSSDGLATYHCDLQKSETTDEFTLVYCARMVHKSGGSHATQTQHEVVAIYGIC